MLRYSEDDIISIIEKTTITISADNGKDLYLRLEAAAEKRVLQKAVNRQSSAKKLQLQFTKIEKAVDKLLKALEIGPTGATRSISNNILDPLHLAASKIARPLGKSGFSLLKDSVDGIVRIKQMSKSIASSAAMRETNRLHHSGVENPRMSKTQHIKYWIMDLSEIYRDFFDAKHVKPTITWNAYDNEPAGLFYYFVCAAETAFRDDGLTNGALAEHIKKAGELMSINFEIEN